MSANDGDERVAAKLEQAIKRCEENGNFAVLSFRNSYFLFFCSDVLLESAIDDVEKAFDRLEMENSELVSQLYYTVLHHTSGGLRVCQNQ